MGLRFTNFHTTAVCSPTRACLLTGRNHHRVGMGMLPDLPTNFPGVFGAHAAAPGDARAGAARRGLRDVLCRASGISFRVISASRARIDMWPTGLGFDRYYGFLNGETNQWTPNLVRDTNHVEPPATTRGRLSPRPSTWPTGLDRLPARSCALAPGPAVPAVVCVSARPRTASGTAGMDRSVPRPVRRRLGRLAGGDVRPRRSASASSPRARECRPTTPMGRGMVDDRRTAPPLVRVDDGGMCRVHRAHADHQIGRVLDHLEATGEVDNTIVVFVSDNGTLGRGRPERHLEPTRPLHLRRTGRHRRRARGYRRPGRLPFEWPLPWGWALAGNTPFRRWKRYTFEGGVRDPFILAGPGVTDAGGIREQYCHATDVLPTVLELCGVDLPDTLNGFKQMSYDGVRLGSVIEDATVAEVRTSQYYECWGSPLCTTTDGKPSPITSTNSPPRKREQITGSHDFATLTPGALQHPQRPDGVTRRRRRRTPSTRGPRQPLVRGRGSRQEFDRRRRGAPHRGHARSMDGRSNQLPIRPR